ncbi:MAG TPA: S41 family peptidase [Segetibacter sp.]|jgi:carboxyl-terminal processing protease
MKKVSIILWLIIVSSKLVLANNDSKEREAMMNKVFTTLETYIANPHWLAGKEYRKFKKLMLSKRKLRLPMNVYTDLFKKEKQKLPFTHFDLISKTPQASETKAIRKSPFSWKEVNDRTVYLDIDQFSDDAAGMFKIIEQIKQKPYQNLIIDLRGNGGGTLDAAVVLARYLTNNSVDAGIYLTRKWYLQNKELPTTAQIASIPYLTDMTYKGIQKMFEKEAAFRMVVPPHQDKIFKGQIYLLTDKQTGSATEPFVYELKKLPNATVVGERTAGAMLSGARFPINDQYNLFLPISDFITADGNRIDKVGVAPDVERKSSEALEYVLSVLIK